jgi:murein L,D-transpeptidase YafK
MGMKNLIALLLCLPLLAACASMPDYLARLNLIRSQKLPELTSELAANDLKPGSPMYIRIFKEEGELEVWVRNDPTGLYQPFKTYRICNYNTTLGPKQERGDMQSPEGFYDVTENQLWPGSQYHLAMNIGYPNQYDQFYNRTGDKLMIHGGCKSEGCFAMTDDGIEEIYILAEQSLEQGEPAIPVHIYPFRMTDANMARYKTSTWYPFWENMKQGYDLFEQNHFPPRVVTQAGHYLFTPQVFVYAGAI